MALITFHVLQIRASFAISKDKDPRVVLIENLPEYYKNDDVVDLLMKLGEGIAVTQVS